ncbi:hypothetical protein GPK34_07045 [Secundilactobacillus kimchicus]|uniref:hypothetical protein n=1 Tax=Secundilactobacillus kimchicus TaxID=528209 RepID=UPI0012E38B75|nr:hypothetical protein [Secundilactobacillus kimchicus]MBT9671786.1 hypothetical protein [Secundilactobacillus kimchicus]
MDKKELLLYNIDNNLSRIANSLETIASSLSGKREADGKAVVDAIEDHLKNLDQRERL